MKPKILYCLFCGEGCCLSCEQWEAFRSSEHTFVSCDSCHTAAMDEITERGWSSSRIVGTSPRVYVGEINHPAPE